MTIIFVIGMSGTGTSTAIERLDELGHQAVDLNEPPWSIYDDDDDWIWRESLVEELLDQASELLFVSGCPTNQTTFYPDHEIDTSAPVEEVIEEFLRVTIQG